jgi:hypothetical protein
MTQRKTSIKPASRIGRKHRGFRYGPVGKGFRQAVTDQQLRDDPRGQPSNADPRFMRFRCRDSAPGRCIFAARPLQISRHFKGLRPLDRGRGWAGMADTCRCILKVEGAGAYHGVLLQRYGMAQTRKSLAEESKKVPFGIANRALPLEASPDAIGRLDVLDCPSWVCRMQCGALALGSVVMSAGRCRG